jgi:glycine/D-amino acid oxidase-like deaminating enzyme
MDEARAAHDHVAPAVTYPDLPSISPWVAQLEPDGPPRPLDRDVTTDVVIVGAGIAGMATAFFTLRNTDRSVLLIERDRVARGASGHNAGQLTTYFERPLISIADEYGAELAIEAQRSLDNSHDLLDLMARESGAKVRVERFIGYMGMYNVNQLLVHLRNDTLRWDGGLRLERCVVSEDADFLDEIPSEYASLYSVVPQSTIQQLLETDDTRYRAVLADVKGCANSGALVQQVLAFLEERYPDRFQYFDHSKVDQVVVGLEDVVVHAVGHTVTGSEIVMCTNGFSDHSIVDTSGVPIELAPDQQVSGVVGYMSAFIEEQRRPPAAMSYIRNVEIGGDTPYVYVTRRTYDRSDGTFTLTCMGGPENPLDAPSYDRSALYPGTMLAHMDEQLRPFAQPARPPGQPYDFHWHGLMGYNKSLIRVVGPHPRHRRVLYNLGCNGVGFLPSTFGGERIARILGGETLPPSIFDPH